MSRVMRRNLSTVLLAVCVSVMLFILAPNFVGYLGDKNGENENVSREQGLGLGVEFSANILGDLSDPSSAVLVELVCRNVQAEDIVVSPFLEWGFNPVFLLQIPDGMSFQSWNARHMLSLQSVVLVPGQNISKVFNLYTPGWTGIWIEEVEEGWVEMSKPYPAPRVFTGSDLFTEPGEYELTIIYRPFYHQYFTNETMANITLNFTLSFRRPGAPTIAHLGTSNLSFLSTDLRAVTLDLGTGPYRGMDGVIDSYDLIIFDNVPPEWIGNSSRALRNAVLERGLDLLFFGGPFSLGGNGSYSSWDQCEIGEMLPVESTGLYSEIPPGYSVKALFSGQKESIFKDLDTTSFDTVRHMNPVCPRPGATVWSLMEWEGQRSEFFLCYWRFGEGKIMVCTAALQEILDWDGGRELAKRMVEATLTE